MSNCAPVGRGDDILERTSLARGTEAPEAPDAEAALVERARSGDHEAFGELVRRHRGRARGWAQKLTKDPHLAEDVVQDALLKAFLHISTLVDAERFMPWLQRIVRNQALNKLRRGGPYGVESPVTLLDAAGDVDSGDVECILTHLARREEAARRDDPEAHALRGEFFAMLKGLLPALSPRQRAIFEAHFFEQLSPQEIAVLFRTTTGNVYTALHRAKARVQQERLRIYIDASVQRRRRQAAMSKKLLARPPLGDEFGTPWHSFASAIYGVLSVTGKQTTTTQVMGLIGHAFRLNIDARQVHVGAPSGFDWAGIARAGLRNLGYEVKTMGAPNHVSPTAEELADAIDLVRRAIDANRPVLAWDLFCGEFGVIYGYDDEAKHFHALDGRSDQQENPTLPYEKLGRGDCTELFLVVLERAIEVDPASALRSALQIAVTQARVQETLTDDVLDIRMITGLAGYDAWIGAFERGSVDPFGNAYNAAVYADARRHAERFLRGIADGDGGWSPLAPRARNLAAQAAAHYSEVAVALGELTARFPFPHGGEPNEPEHASAALASLQRARSAESHAVETLESLLEVLSTEQ